MPDNPRDTTRSHRHRKSKNGESTPQQRSRGRLTALVTYALLLALCLPIGTLWHEVVGHGLVGTLAGGRITHVEVLGLDLWPQPRWIGWQGHYGWCDVEGIAGQTGEHLMALAGSLSTWLVAAAATIALYARRWRAWLTPVLVCLSLWWIDLFTYTLPTWGIRRSILWGQVYSEPYEAAVQLGIPGTLFQVFVVTTSALLAAALAIRLTRRSLG